MPYTSKHYCYCIRFEKYSANIPFSSQHIANESRSPIKKALRIVEGPPIIPFD